VVDDYTARGAACRASFARSIETSLSIYTAVALHCFDTSTMQPASQSSQPVGSFLVITGAILATSCSMNSAVFIDGDISLSAPGLRGPPNDLLTSYPQQRLGDFGPRQTPSSSAPTCVHHLSVDAVYSQARLTLSLITVLCCATFH